MELLYFEIYIANALDIDMDNRGRLPFRYMHIG